MGVSSQHKVLTGVGEASQEAPGRFAWCVEHGVRRVLQGWLAADPGTPAPQWQKGRKGAQSLET